MEEEITIEQMIAVIMTMKDLLGEFSVDMYYNDLAEPNERCVVKFKVHEPTPDSSRTAEYFRCSSFKEGLDKLLYFLISKITL